MHRDKNFTLVKGLEVLLTHGDDDDDDDHKPYHYHQHALDGQIE